MKYACFISYCHVQGEIINSFINQLQKALTDEIALHIGAPPCSDKALLCIDRTLLQPGFLFHKALAQAICNSECMIVVYSPVYDGHDYCRQEFEGMKLLEQERRKRLGREWPQECGMIIPIILRGKEDDLPDVIKAYRQYCTDFRQFRLGDPPIGENIKYRDSIAQIVNVIYENHKKFEKAKAAGIDLCDSCNSFSLPPLNEIPPWQPDDFPNRESLQ